MRRKVHAPIRVREALLKQLALPDRHPRCAEVASSSCLVPDHPVLMLPFPEDLAMQVTD